MAAALAALNPRPRWWTTARWSPPSLIGPAQHVTPAEPHPFEYETTHCYGLQWLESLQRSSIRLAVAATALTHLLPLLRQNHDFTIPASSHS